MSVENALKMLKDEKIALEREAVKINRAIQALESSGITRARAKSSSNGGQKPKPKPKVMNQDYESNSRRLLEHIHHNPGQTVKEMTEVLNMSSEGYVYKHIRAFAAAGAIRNEGFPRKWYPV